MVRHRPCCDRPRAGLVVCDALPSRTEGRCWLGGRGGLGSGRDDLGSRQRGSCFVVEPTQEASVSEKRVGARRRAAARGRNHCDCPLPSRPARQPFIVLRPATNGRLRSTCGQLRSVTEVSFKVGYPKMKLQSPIPLAHNATVSFARHFHVEALRGGMNRLLLRALPTESDATRVEVLFQYVQHLHIPMRFDGLEIADTTVADSEQPEFNALLRRFPECRIFRLISRGQRAGEVVASACSFGEDSATTGASSMFPMM